MQHSSFVIVKQFDSGGMSDIYLGIYSPTLRKPCVVKRMKEKFASNAHYRNAFFGEAIVGQRLHHSNIVQVFDFVRDGNTASLVMEYVEGSNLASILKTCASMKISFSIPMAVYIGIEVAKALQYAHNTTNPENGQNGSVIHRDVSLSNILVSQHGEVKITDFGVAKLSDKGNEFEVGVLKGKQGYFSPEQLAGQEPSPKTDIYSLGICLWEALSMKRMYPGDDFDSVTAEVLSGVRQDLRSINPEVDEHLSTIIDRCLALDPSQRFASAAELEKVLTAYLHKNFVSFRAGKLGTFVKTTVGQQLAERNHLIEKALQDPQLFLQHAPSELAVNPPPRPAMSKPAKQKHARPGVARFWFGMAAITAAALAIGGYYWQSGKGLAAMKLKSPKQAAEIQSAPGPLPKDPRKQD